MGRAEREMYDELKQKYRDLEKQLQRAGTNHYKRADALSALHEQCSG
jgi:hypothetical protein